MLRGVSARYPIVGNTTSADVQRRFQPSVSAALSQRGDALVAEGSTVTYAVKLDADDAAVGGVVVAMSWSVEFVGVGPGHAEAADFVRATRGRVVLINTNSAVFRVGIKEDETRESRETFRVRLSNLQGPANVRLSAASSAVDSVIARNGNDYDLDDNDLIDVMTTSQLSAIRYDLDGDGMPDRQAYVTSHSAVFPFFDELGSCPGGCKGYELQNDLDLSSGGNWDPIGGGGVRPAVAPGNVLPEEHRYKAVFEGNGHIIRNLTMFDRDSNTGQSPNGHWHFVGLFRALDGGVIRNLGLVNVRVGVTISSIHTGALVGTIHAGSTVTACYVVDGEVGGGWGVGGLAGVNIGGTIIASYTDVAVLVGASSAGGLTGNNLAGGRIIASYALGSLSEVSPFFPNFAKQFGGLAGTNDAASTAVVESSYFNRESSGKASSGGVNVPSSSVQTSRTLRLPTAAEGIYAGWDKLDVDGVDQGRDGDFNDDAPWDFGSSLEYPVLRGMSARYPIVGNTTSADVQRRFQPSVSAALSQRGDALVAEGSTVTYAVKLDADDAAVGGVVVAMSWSVEFVGVGPGHAEAADFVRATRGRVVLINTNSAVFRVGIKEDETRESRETFRVRLSNLQGPANVRLGAASSAVVSIIARNGNDYDLDNDNLIDVMTTSQLSAIRYDLDGDGMPDRQVYATSHSAAFPFSDEFGICPDGCKGYELQNDLDLSSGGNWDPIGGGGARPSIASGNVLAEEHRYKAVFDGNGHVIRNLTMFDRDSGTGFSDNGVWHFVGLFRALDGGVIRNLGLVNVRVGVHISSIHTGALVGTIHAGSTVAASYVVDGEVGGGWGVGGLAGVNIGGTIIASYTDVTVLVGASSAGGLTGNNLAGGRIIASYALGSLSEVSPFFPNFAKQFGGLAGTNDAASTAVVESSYFNRESSGKASSGGVNVPSSSVQTSRTLRLPTAAEGIYAGWDGLDLDGDGDFNDAPWDFGGPFQYPVLRQARTEAAVQAQYSRQPTVTLTPTFAGAATVSEGTSASYEVSLGRALPPGIAASWSWSVGSSDAGVDGGDFDSLTSGRVAIGPGLSSASFSLEVADDGRPEFAEVFEVSLSDARLAGASGNARLVNPSAGVRTTIAANELGQVTVAAPSATVAEGATATFTLRLSGGGYGDVSVDFSVVPASGEVTPADLERMTWSDHEGTESKLVSSFENSTGIVALTRMNNVATVSVWVAADDVPGESGERFRVELTGCRGCAAAFVEIGVPSSAQVTISRTPLPVSTWVYLQGAYAGSSRMRTTLAGVLPQRQPYGAAPWHYRSDTTVPHVPEVGLGGVAQPIVDWVLVELRASTSGAGAGAAVPVVEGFAAGLLLADGRIAGIDESATTAGAALSLEGVPIAAGFAPGSEIYVLIHHRNHLSVMSALPVAYGGVGCEGGYCVDFRRRRSYDGCAHLRHADGNRLMAAGDVNRSGMVSWGDDALTLNTPSAGVVCAHGIELPGGR